MFRALVYTGLFIHYYYRKVRTYLTSLMLYIHSISSAVFNMLTPLALSHTDTGAAYTRLNTYPSEQRNEWLRVSSIVPKCSICEGVVNMIRLSLYTDEVVLEEVVCDFRWC